MDRILIAIRRQPDNLCKDLIIRSTSTSTSFEMKHHQEVHATRAKDLWRRYCQTTPKNHGRSRIFQKISGSRKSLEGLKLATSYSGHFNFWDDSQTTWICVKINTSIVFLGTLSSEFLLSTHHSFLTPPSFSPCESSNTKFATVQARQVANYCRIG